jgi:hypothetical protein
MSKISKGQPNPDLKDYGAAITITINKDSSIKDFFRTITDSHESLSVYIKDTYKVENPEILIRQNQNGSMFLFWRNTNG